MVLPVHVFATRAVDVKNVPILGADSCIAAITRFIARKGKPKTKLSDNEFNLVDAETEIPERIAACKQSDVEQSLAQRQIKWNPTHHLR